MTISIHDPRLKRLSMLAEKRHLDWWPQSNETFLVSSSRAGVPPYRLTLKDDSIDCPCDAGSKGLACSHAALMVEHQFPSIALAWATEDARAFYEKRLAIEKGEVGKRELNRYRKAYHEFLSSEMEVAA